MDAHRVAFNTWQEKTEWVQKDKRFDVLLPWGKHRADVLKEYIDHLEARCAALASIESEPVYQVFSFKRWRDVSEEVFEAEKKDGCQVRVLYTTPPAPVSVPAAMNTDDDFDSAFEHGKAVGWNACRAAMLQCADGNSPVIPESWVACSDRLPDPDSAFRVCAYTPTPHEDFRFRSVPASLFKSVCRDATHWQYMLPPAAPQQEVKP